MLPSRMDTTERVIEELRKRRAKGIAKYGMTVDENPLTDKQWLQHLKEELLDAVIYIERMLNATTKIS